MQEPSDLTPRLALPENPWIGGGDAGRLIAELDWAATPLGPRATWSVSLRTAVGMMLAVGGPACLVWGPGHVQLYNDGYAHVIGHHHPGALGCDFRASWAEYLPVIGDAYAAARAGRATQLDEVHAFLDRDGCEMEGWATLAFSPITGEDGAIAGVFHTITDQTRHALAVRRRRTLMELQARAPKAHTSAETYAIAMRVLAEAAADVPFALLYLVDPTDERATLLEQTGLPDDDAVCPRSVGPGDHDAWGVAETMRTGALRRVDLGDRLAGRVVGPYPNPPSHAVAVPLVRLGSEQTGAVLVLGLSARLVVDDAYLVFCELVASTISGAAANAAAYGAAHARIEALAELDRAKTMFFSNVSHELRTPLTLIIAPIEDALRTGVPLAGDRLELVARNANRLLRLVNDLLSFSRLEAGVLESTFVPTDLAAVTRALVEAFRSLVEPAGLALTIDCPALPAPVYVDRDQWEKIVTNLVANAFKFTLAGAIVVSLRAIGDAVELRVTDTGIGIPVEELGRVFERFHRIDGDRGRSVEGSGIGLALVHELVRQHAGRLDVVSEVGVGSTFVVTLTTGQAHLPADRVRLAPPAAALRQALPPRAETVRTSRIASPMRPTGAPRRARILVVDDNPDLRGYLIEVLSPLGLVEGVADGHEALARALASPPELVLTDVMMPGLDGFGLLRALRADPRTSTTPVVLMSARTGEERVIEGLAQGANDYLLKPFSSRELVSRVRTHLETAQLRRELLLGARELDAIVENVPHMLFVKDAERLTFTRINRAGEVLLGVDRSVLLGKSDHDFFPPDQVEQFTTRDRETLAGTIGVDIVEEPIDTPHGRRWLHTKKVPIFDEHGRPRYLLGISEDITDRRLQQDELVRAKEAAEIANRELESFSYSVAHDLRAPLRGIDGFAQALAEDYAAQLDADGQRYLRFVRESAQRMGVLIDDLLDLSRVTRSEVVRQDVDLSALAAAVVGRLERHEPGRVVTVDVQPAMVADGDAHLLGVVLDNLIGNAWKFTRKRLDAHIAVGATIGDDGVTVFFVRDNGAGFDEAYANKLFGVFQRLHSQQEFEGTGVGLATVQRIVLRHGGRLWARGVVGEGATFSFSLHKSGRPHD